MQHKMLLSEVINAGQFRNLSQAARVADIWNNSRWVDDLKTRKQIVRACAWALRRIRDKHGSTVFFSVVGLRLSAIHLQQMAELTQIEADSYFKE